MAGEIKITGPLKFIGYEQTALPGSNGQVITYQNGLANWATPAGGGSGTLSANGIITSSRNVDSIIDSDGNVLEAARTKYVGVNTKPIERPETVQVDNTRVDNPNFLFNDNISATVSGSNITIDSVNTNTGEVNTNTNAVTPGTGEAGLVNTKIGVDTPIKVIKAGDNITLTENANDVTINTVNNFIGGIFECRGGEATVTTGTMAANSASVPSTFNFDLRETINRPNGNFSYDSTTKELTFLSAGIYEVITSAFNIDIRGSVVGTAQPAVAQGFGSVSLLHNDDSLLFSGATTLAEAIPNPTTWEIRDSVAERTEILIEVANGDTLKVAYDISTARMTGSDWTWLINSSLRLILIKLSD